MTPNIAAGQLIDRDLEHLRLLKYGYYILACLSGFQTLTALIFITLGSVFASGALPIPNTAQGVDPSRFIGFIFLTIGFVFLLIGAAVSTLIYYAGKFVGQHRKWTYCMVIAGICCLQVPWGTALGICTFLVLGRPGVKALFGQAVYAPPAAAPVTPPPFSPPA